MDFDINDQSLIATATDIYEVLLFTITAFSNNRKQNEFIVDAWEEACQIHAVTCRMSFDVKKIVCGLIFTMLYSIHVVGIFDVATVQRNKHTQWGQISCLYGCSYCMAVQEQLQWQSTPREHAQS